MSIEASYGHAVRSSNLKMKNKDIALGDVETIAAAGMASSGKPLETGVAGEVRKETKDMLGTLLMRLRAEFDSTRRAQLIAQANHSNAIKAAAAASRREETRELAQTMREAAAATALSDHLLILIELRSLNPAVQALGRFATAIAERRRFELEPTEISAIVSGVINSWLDRKCHKCDGRGFTGGYDGPTIRCRACRETGNRRLGFFSDRLVGQALAEKLLSEMDRACEAAQRKMNRLLR